MSSLFSVKPSSTIIGAEGASAVSSVGSKARLRFSRKPTSLTGRDCFDVLVRTPMRARS